MVSPRRSYRTPKSLKNWQTWNNLVICASFLNISVTFDNNWTWSDCVLARGSCYQQMLLNGTDKDFNTFFYLYLVFTIFPLTILLNLIAKYHKTKPPGPYVPWIDSVIHKPFLMPNDGERKWYQNCFVNGLEKYFA